MLWLVLARLFIPWDWQPTPRNLDLLAKISFVVHVRATKVLLQHGRVLELDPALEQFPYFLLVVCMTSELEIVDVDAEDPSQLRMPVATSPVDYGQEACFTQFSVTMLLPACAGIWVTIERKHEWTHWVPHVRPRFWPLFPWYPYPSGNSSEFGLHVGSHGVGLHQDPSRQKAKEVEEFAGRHASRGGTEVLERGEEVAFVSDITATEDYTPFVLSLRVALGQLRTFFHADSEYHADVHADALLLGFLTYVCPFADSLLFPRSNFS